MKQPVILIVIPAFNEADRLPRYLEKLLPELSRVEGAELWLRVVDDGSEAHQRRRLAEALRVLGKNDPQVPLLPLLELSRNLGKGGAILAGWGEGLGGIGKNAPDYYAFLDADGAIPPAEVVRVIADVAELAARAEARPISFFASRARLPGREVSRSVHRHFMGRVFAFLTALLICRDVQDSQCGFKLIPAEHWERIRGRVKGNRFAFDIELLAALSENSLPIVEIPIDWTDVPGSKVSLGKDSWRMFCFVLETRRKMRCGHYRVE